MRSDRIRLAAAASLLLLFLFLPHLPARAAERSAEPRIAILATRKGAPYEEIGAGFRKRLQATGANPAYAAFFLDDPGAEPAFREAARAGLDLVFALGGEAAAAASRLAPGVPVVSGGVLRAGEARSGGNATGVYLEYPPAVPMQWIRTALPGARVVGLLYNPEENRERVESAARAARELGLRLETRAVSSPRELPAAMDSLYRRSDVVWTMYDGVATTPETAQRLLLDSFRHRVPLIGLSVSWLNAGAFAAPDWDHEDIGAQCADTAARILKGEKAAGIPPVPPRRAGFALNLESARKIGIRVPKAAVAEARRLFPGKE